MASDITRGPSSLGIPTLYEHDEGTKTASYPHLVTQFASSFFQRTCIDVRVGPPDAGICRPPQSDFVQHPKPFGADGTLTMASRTLLITCARNAANGSKFRMCIVWSATSCSYVEADGFIFETTSGVTLPASQAFEGARLLRTRDNFPQINVKAPYGIARVDFPANATKGEIVSIAVEIATTKELKTRIAFSETEIIHAELTDKLEEQFSTIRPCAVWAASQTIDPDPASWHASLTLKYPRIVAGGHRECLLFYPDALGLEDLVVKAAGIVARGWPRVRLVCSPTETIYLESSL